MIREVVKDVDFLSQISVSYDEKLHKSIIADLLDTAKAHQPDCLGLAAVQIGKLVRLIAVHTGDNFMIMKNPIILSHSATTYLATEGCLSLEGERTVKRYSSITVLYADIKGKPIKRNYNGAIAEIIQHECDHLKGILI